MSVPTPRMQPCPGCGMPRLADAIERSPCPICADATQVVSSASPPSESPAVDPFAHLPADASVLYAPPPSPSQNVVSSGWSWRALTIAFAAGTLLGGLTVAVFLTLSSPQPPPPETEAFVSPIPTLAQHPPSASPDASASPPSPTPTSTPQLEATSASEGSSPPASGSASSPLREKLEQPAPDKAEKPAAAPPALGKVGKLAPEKRPPLPPPQRQERIIARLEQPAATYTVPEEWLQPGNIIVLRGRVRELRVPHMPPHVQLDARELTAASIYVGGERLEMVQLHLHAPEGVIAFRTVIGQGTRLHIDAPGGIVRFGLANPWQELPVLIHQGAQVYVRARQLQVDGVVRDPQTRLLMDWTGPARLRLEAVEHGAQVLYRRTAEGQNTRIEAHATTVDPSATFRATEN